MSPLFIKSKDGTTKSFSANIVDKFKDNMHDDLITPEDAQYESARKLWNGMIDKKPALIARCALEIFRVRFKISNVFSTITTGY